MSRLNKLKPAETLLLQHASKAELKDLMKMTFMDLTMKQVLEVKNGTTKVKTRSIVHREGCSVRHNRKELQNVQTKSF